MKSSKGLSGRTGYNIIGKRILEVAPKKKNELARRIGKKKERTKGRALNGEKVR